MRKEFQLQTKDGVKPVLIQVDEVYNVGYAGRDQEVVRKHVEELAEMGVAVPNHVPTIYPVSSTSVSTDHVVEVIHDKTSGEIEYVLFLSDGKEYLGIGSDHSDRDLETYNVPMAKQMCPNLVAETVWPMEEVADHFDQLVMRAYVTKDGVRSLYQEGSVAELMDPKQQVEQVEAHLGRKCQNAVIYSGTLPTKDGMICGEKFEYEMVDPVLDRRIASEYDLKFLPQPRD
ncbi:MAG: DUF2848 family protein [Lawsonibacter sp.]